MKMVRLAGVFLFWLSTQRGLFSVGIRQSVNNWLPVDGKQNLKIFVPASASWYCHHVARGESGESVPRELRGAARVRELRSAAAIAG
jgi:hypothetical protein